MIPGSKSRPQADVLVGLSEIAVLLNVKRATVDKWRQRDVLPEAYQELEGGPVWWQTRIIRWATLTGRL